MVSRVGDRGTRLPDEGRVTWGHGENLEMVTLHKGGLYEVSLG